MVEDEWERELVTAGDSNLDLLFVKYRKDSVTIDQMTKVIEEHGFTATIETDAVTTDTVKTEATKENQ